MLSTHKLLFTAVAGLALATGWVIVGAGDPAPAPAPISAPAPTDTAAIGTAVGLAAPTAVAGRHG